jgi:CRISPR/Cas system-associated exonuclease Cas4 (RecB family)
VKFRCTGLEGLLYGCPVRYLIDSRGAKSVSSEAAQRGTNTHTLLEYAITQQYDKLKLTLDTFKGDKHFPFYVSCLDQFSKWIKEYDVQVLVAEQLYSVDIPIESEVVKLTGKPDLIAKIKIDGVYYNTIVDYKTSSGVKESDLYKYQIVWYAYMSKLIANQSIEKVAILNFSGMKTSKMTFFHRELKPIEFEWLEKMIQYAYYTEKRGYFQKGYNTCSWCDYKDICKQLPETVDLAKDTNLLMELISTYNRSIEHPITSMGKNDSEQK